MRQFRGFIGRNPSEIFPTLSGNPICDRIQLMKNWLFWVGGDDDQTGNLSCNPISSASDLKGIVRTRTVCADEPITIRTESSDCPSMDNPKSVSDEGPAGNLGGLLGLRGRINKHGFESPGGFKAMCAQLAGPCGR